MAVKWISRFIGIMLFCFLILGCGDSATESEQPVLTFRQSGCLEGTAVDYRSTPASPYIVDVGSSGCLDSLAGTFADPSSPGGTVRFGVSHDTVFVYHDSAFYNCCAEFAYQVEQHSDTLDFIEADTASAGCYCLCHFNLQTSAAGVGPGTYTVRLWAEGREFLLGEATLTVPGAGNIWFETNCDTLRVYHHDLYANCGAVVIFDFAQEGPVLTLTEIDTSSTWMHCMCYFNVSARVVGLESGAYTVRLRDQGNTHGLGGEVDSLITEAAVTISCL